MNIKNFFYFCGSLLPSWIRIRIPNPDPDPLTRFSPDPIRIQIRNPSSNSSNAGNSRNAGKSSHTAIARTPVKGGTARLQATFWKVRYTNNNSVCHNSIDASNRLTPKQQQGISVMPLKSWIQATARKQKQGRQ
jgi:hypothetical protein